MFVVFGTFLMLFVLSKVRQSQMGTVRCMYCAKPLKRIGLGQRAHTCHHCGKTQPGY